MQVLHVIIGGVRGILQPHSVKKSFFQERSKMEVVAEMNP